MPTVMALGATDFSQSARLVRLGALFQRASIVIGFAWFTALIRTRTPAPPTTRIARTTGDLTDSRVRRTSAYIQ